MTSREEIEHQLTEWAANNARRDGLVSAALAAGVTPNRIHTLTGIARTTIYRIKETAVQNTQRLAEQITPTLGDRADDFDIPGIVDLIGELFGFDVNIDDIPSEKYWEIVQKYDTTDHDAV
jgi:hypothetical protein